MCSSSSPFSTTKSTILQSTLTVQAYPKMLANDDIFIEMEYFEIYFEMILIGRFLDKFLSHALTQVFDPFLVLHFLWIRLGQNGRVSKCGSCCCALKWTACFAAASEIDYY
ncbi:hypothetical protein Tsp_06340 [Trichinella spiralis]|uniref:hypothetical protein n=1 Tax=Trichinella spiralis TaxID=6334 RepID=UPI0001EFBED9|nr:hypothetical protein Tsp_06340 [Trichinella spiralis]